MPVALYLVGIHFLLRERDRERKRDEMGERGREIIELIERGGGSALSGRLTSFWIMLVNKSCDKGNKGNRCRFGSQLFPPIRASK